MATLLHGESRQLYSWWWGSHISPKNSKWLQENLTDVDMKVKAMIKLIEEDADSFARRAEMYYKKRPELMKLVEEFYRAYRALAERYDHATGALRQAHRTMAEAFPNQVPLVLPDESPSGSSGMEMEPQTPEMPTPIRASFDPDDLQKDALGVSSHFHAIKRNGAYSGESDASSSKKGLKQLNEMFATGEGAADTNLTEGRVGKGLNFHEEEGKVNEPKLHSGSRDLEKLEIVEKEDSSNEMKNLHEEISRLSTETQNLRKQITSESEHANKAQKEIESLKDSLSKLNSEKNASLLQYQLSLERISSLESEISNGQNEFKKLSDEMMREVMKLRGAEELNQSLRPELEMLEQKEKVQQQELDQKQEELEKLIISLEDVQKRCTKAEMALQSREKLYSQSQEEVKLLGLEIQKMIEKLKDMEYGNVGLEEEVHRLKEENDSLNEQNLSSAIKIKDLQDEIITLKDTKRTLEMALQSMEKQHTQSQDGVKLLGLEIQKGIEKLKDMEQSNAGLEEEVRKLKEEIGSLNKQNISSAAKIKDLQDEIIFLNETKRTIDLEVDVHVEEKKVLQQKLYHLEEDRSDLLQRNQGLMEQIKVVSVNAESLQELVCKLKEEINGLNEQNLSSAAKVKDLQDEIIFLNETKRTLDHDVSLHVEEKKVLQQELCHLEEDRSDILQRNQGLMEEIKAVSVNAESVQELAHKLKEENDSLNEQILSSAAKVKDLQDEIIFLNETKRTLDHEVSLHVEEKKVLQQELCHLEEDRSDLLQRNQGLMEQIKVVSVNAESLQELVCKLKEEINGLNEQNLSSAAKVKDLQDEIIFLNETTRTLDHEVSLHVEEKKVLQQELCHLEEDRSVILQRNQRLMEEIKAVNVNAESVQELAHKLKEENDSLNEQILSSAAKVKDLQDEIIFLNETKRTIDHEVSLHVEEKKVLQQELCHLEEDRNDLLQRNQGLIEQIKVVSVNAESLQELVCKLKEEINGLNEQNLSSAAKVKDLQDEIIFLNETKRTLDHDVSLHVEEKKVLQQELCHLEEDRSDILQRNQGLMEQIKAVSVNAESLQELVKELQNGNMELKEICKKHEVEKELILEKLKNMDRLLEKNVFLENSISDANVELELLRHNIGALEASKESLGGEISTLISDKALLVSQVEIHAKNVEKISEKNAFLEYSLSDVNAELECLRTKLKDSEESCQSLNDQNSSLLTEKHTFANQVKSVTESLEYLKLSYAALEDKHSSLLREKDLTLTQVKELQDLLKLEKQEHETSIQSYKGQLVTLENQIHCLQEEIHLMEEELELEELKNMNALLDIFILQRSLCDMKEGNLILSKEYQKHLETSLSAERLVSQLEQENLVQRGEMVLLTEHNEKLKEGIYHVVKTLNTNKNVESVDGINGEVSLQNMIVDIKRLLNCISDTEDENQHLHIEISVLVTLLKQIGMDLADMRWEKCVIEQELHVKVTELLTLQNKKHELLEMNEELRQVLMASNQREEVLKTDMDILRGQLSVLQESHQMLRTEICEHVEENQSLLKELYSLREKHNELVNENSVVLAEAMTLEHLYFFFRSINAERMLELKLLNEDLDCLHLVKNDLDYQIKELNRKTGVLLAENMHLKESIIYLEELGSRSLILEFDLNTATGLCEELHLQIESMNNLLAQKDRELSEANQKILSTQEKNKELCTVLEALQLDIVVAKMVKEELEKKISLLSGGNALKDKEIACLTEANEMMQGEINRLHEEAEVLIRREEHLTSELQKEIDEVKHCEGEIAELVSDAQTSAVNAALYEEKVFELIVEGESLQISAFVQKEMLNEVITLRNAYIGELKKKLFILEGETGGLKADLNAYLPLLMSLLDSVTSLEEHTLSLSNFYAPKDHKEQDMTLMFHQHDESGQLGEDHGAVVPAGVLVMQKLITKVEALKQVISLVEQEKFAFIANLEATRKEIEELKATAMQGNVQEGSIRQWNEDEDIDDAESSKVKCEQRMKDIQLDQVSSSSQHGNGVGSYGLSNIEDAEIDDQMLQLWETAERDCNHGTWKASSVAMEYDIQAVGEDKGECPSSELGTEKELSIDKLEIPKRASESQQEWNRRVLERLASDSQRLSALQTSVEELKGKMESSEKGKRPMSSEYDTIRAQLKKAESTLLELIDITGKLMKKAKDFSVPSDDVAVETGELGNVGRKQMSEGAWKGSEKIGGLELELQKIQYILLKLEEEHENSQSKAVDRRARVLLRDYFYGRRDNPRQKKRSPFCGCLRIKTKGD